MGYCSHRRFAALLFGAFAAILLSSCGGGSGTDARLSAATYGPVSSPAFESVRELFSIGAPVASAQVLVVDGDARAPGELARDPVIQEHLRAGKWVVLVDLTKPHNDHDVVPLAHAAGGGDSHIALVRRRNDAFGRPAIDLYDFPKKGVGDLTANDLAELRRSVQEFLNKQAGQAPRDFSPPNGLLYVTFNFSTPIRTPAMRRFCRR